MSQELVLDVRGLEPPEPLERVLEAISTMAKGDSVLMLIDRQPFPLYRILEQNGFTHETLARDDGVFEIRIHHRS